MLCHGGAWLVEACLMVIHGWQMAVHGKKGISWLAIATMMEHSGSLKEIHGEFVIWLAEL
jgi:hypothetical protein